MPSMRCCVAFVLFVLLLFESASSQKASRVLCSAKEACIPYSVNGTRQGVNCARGNKMSVRLSLEIAPERIGIDTASTMDNVSYAFCPVVDELQAFNLTEAGRLIGTYPDPHDVTNFFLSKKVTQIFLYAYGFGGQDNELRPQLGSEGMVMVVDNVTTPFCPYGALDVATFLVLNISMKKGKFVYDPEFRQPAGVGFMPTCSSKDICIFDQSMHCMGVERGRKNCAECIYDGNELARKGIMVWTSYYGTDKSGRTYKSGSSNPLNFRAFAAGNVFSKIGKSYDNIAMGELATEGTVAQD